MRKLTEFDRYTMMWQIVTQSKYDDVYLLSLSDEKLKKIYKEKVIDKNE